MTFPSPSGNLITNTTYSRLQLFGFLVRRLNRASATGLQLGIYADTAVLGSHYNIKARSLEVLGEGSDRSRQLVRGVESTRALRELERAPCTWSGLWPRSAKAVAPNSWRILNFWKVNK